MLGSRSPTRCADMRLRSNDTVLYSATDLVNFLGCAHATSLDLEVLGQALTAPKKEDDEYLQLLSKLGIEHERSYLEKLRAEGRSIEEINLPDEDIEGRHAATLAAMQRGMDVIYQGALLDAPWHGYSDFLLKIHGIESRFGKYAYEVADTKLSRTAKPKHVIQLCVYSTLIAHAQDAEPRDTHIVLGDGTKLTLKVRDFMHYFGVAKGRFEAAAGQRPPAAATTAEPCGHCMFCKWKATCEAEWEDADHLSLVASISRLQISKLRAHGVDSIGQLAELDPETHIKGMQPRTLRRLTHQARLQQRKRTTNENVCEVLDVERDRDGNILTRGFCRLPQPDEGDIFFDMEGDPLFGTPGLEYLFGFNSMENGKETFTPFWAHDRAAERVAFERAVDFIVERLKRAPNAHVYHYASYEKSALKRLSSFHSTREAEVDDLLRGHKLVDLYAVVREGIRVSEPSYSLKNLERFYGLKRTDTVSNAGDSILAYERWRKLDADPASKAQADKQLKDIADYNEVDCRSTRLCRDWLLGKRPDGAVWFSSAAASDLDEAKLQEIREREAESLAIQEAIVEGIADGANREWRELLGLLIDFHRREAKPEYWAMFYRFEEAELEELLDDPDCLADLTADTSRERVKVKGSFDYSYFIPRQEARAGEGKFLRTDTRGQVTVTEVEDLPDGGMRLTVRIGAKQDPIPDGCSLIPTGPIRTESQQAAIRHVADCVIKGNLDSYPAITSLLRAEYPAFRGRATGERVVQGDDPLAGAIDAIGRLDGSYLLIQGPPGAGKTFTSSHAIVQLMRDGKRVGISSNSHKAIANLAKAICKEARNQGVAFKGIKKHDEDDIGEPDFIEVVDDNEAIEEGGHLLVAGTSWLFSREKMRDKLDYLFIDEAGQVSLANVIAMGTCARNIVLVGDQMQLAQPIKGAHPGKSGLSALEYLLEGRATVPEDRGIFLAVTHRMHPSICEFISRAVYDERLEAAVVNERQSLVLGNDVVGPLAPTGIRFAPVDHSANSQECAEEAEAIRGAYECLLGQSWTDAKGDTHPITAEEILVVTPWNMQVSLLKAMLPEGARVGTVDKFQGQEAPVVLISMATSSGDDVTRGIDFLFSRNRLNVAISRARALAVIYASPRLLEVSCHTIEQMKLVNTLCWARAYADSSGPSAALNNASTSSVNGTLA